MDMGCIVRLKNGNHTFGFMFKHGLVYDFEKDVLVKSYFITQLFPVEPTYMMTDAFFYSKKFEHAFTPGHSNSCATITYCFVGEGNDHYKKADFCPMVTVSYSEGKTMAVCPDHENMYPFCSCTFHYKKHESMKEVFKIPTARIILPLNEPFLQQVMTEKLYIMI